MDGAPATQPPVEPRRAGGKSSRGRSGAGNRRTPAAYNHCDFATEVLLYAMVVFSPWAFGTTEPWSIWTMNTGGYLLGLLLAAKWIIRRKEDFEPARWGFDRGSGVHWLTRVLGWLTVLVLAYTCLAGINARVSYAMVEGRRFVQYLEAIRWLPHSYDQRETLSLFIQYTALACVFWSARDWLLGKTRRERGGENRDEDAGPGASPLIPDRLRRLLWVLCINGAILGLVSILQRLDGTNKLLWIQEPHINVTGVSQFGPYAYRSNGAQYFNLLWPVCLAFWWVLRRERRLNARIGERIGESAHVLLLPCAIIMAACPIISTSRGGALLLGGMLPIAGAVLFFGDHDHKRSRLGLVAVFGCIIALAGYLGWTSLAPRLKEMDKGDLGGRQEIYDNARKMAEDFVWLGSGPGSFSALYEVYRSNPDQLWQAYLHNDWLETRITYGWIGFGAIVLALLACIAHWPMAPGIPSDRLLPGFIFMAMCGCLLHALYDLPFQIHSILFLFLLLACILGTLSRTSPARRR